MCFLVCKLGLLSNWWMRCARDFLGEVFVKDNGKKAGVERERLQKPTQAQYLWKETGKELDLHGSLGFQHSSKKVPPRLVGDPLAKVAWQQCPIPQDWYLCYVKSWSGAALRTSEVAAGLSVNHAPLPHHRQVIKPPLSFLKQLHLAFQIRKYVF